MREHYNRSNHKINPERKILIYHETVFLLVAYEISVYFKNAFEREFHSNDDVDILVM